MTTCKVCNGTGIVWIQGLGGKKVRDHCASCDGSGESTWRDGTPFVR